MSDINYDTEYLLFAGENNEPEIFFTLEGEGEYIGQPSVFMRFFGCNLTCRGFVSKDSPHGCDSYISWSKKNKISFNDTYKLLEKHNYINKLKDGAILKYTGGEPLIRQKQLLKFTEFLTDKLGMVPKIDFETNATLLPDERWVVDFNASFTTSPKLPSNGDPVEKTYVPDVLKWHADHYSGFKFVINSDKDIEHIWAHYVDDKLGINVETNRIWLMPCCGSREEHIEKAPAVAEYAKALCVNFSPRLHLLLWNKALKV